MSDWLSAGNNAGEGRREARAGQGGLLQFQTAWWRKASLIKGLQYCNVEGLIHMKRTEKKLYQDENTCIADILNKVLKK